MRLHTAAIVDRLAPNNTTNSPGGQAANAKLMQLFADTCNIPVILPFSSSAAVVLGSAMLARFAAEVHRGRSGKELETQQDVEGASNTYRERLWNIMVCANLSLMFFYRVCVWLISVFRPTRYRSGGDDAARCKDRTCHLPTREKAPGGKVQDFPGSDRNSTKVEENNGRSI